jgi:diketogulonate reductase-like aldo/keto reductase
MPILLDRRVLLNTGAQMPVMGLGTFRCKGAALRSAVAHALRQGVRLLDTAEGYKNAADVAAGIAESGVPRSDVFVVSKVAKQSMSEAAVRACVAEQAALFGGYVDLMLVHWPGTANANTKSPAHAKARALVWATLSELHGAGKGPLRAIGVSNYSISHLEQLLSAVSSDGCHVVVPAVNQVEVHPFYPQRGLRAFCRDKGIHVQAFTSLGRCTEPPRCLYGNWEPDLPRLVANPVVKGVAERSGMSEPQVLLAWALQQGLSVIPKATSPAHIDANCATEPGRLPLAEVEALDGLDAKGAVVYAYRPEKVPL